MSRQKVRAVRFVDVPRTTVYRVPVGCWAVKFTPLWVEREDGSEYVFEVEAEVYRVTESCIDWHGCEPEQESPVVDLDCSDTHDLRSRLFFTRREANEHRVYTLKRFRHPQPWESFVRVA